MPRTCGVQRKPSLERRLRRRSQSPKRRLSTGAPRFPGSGACCCQSCSGCDEDPSLRIFVNLAVVYLHLAISEYLQKPKVRENGSPDCSLQVTHGPCIAEDSVCKPLWRGACSSDSRATMFLATVITRLWQTRCQPKVYMSVYTILPRGTFWKPVSIRGARF